MGQAFEIERLGAARVRSPIHLGTKPGDLLADFTPDDARVITELDLESVMAYVERGNAPPSLELAGPREKIYFDPSKVRAGIVTCGGICPGLNNVIRGITMTLHHEYGVRKIFGFQYGFAGLNPEYGYPAMELTPQLVRDIHNEGGTILGTSRGPHDVDSLVETLDQMSVSLLFTIGGDGTFRGALAISDEIKRRGLKIGVVGVPKTIDNDILMVDRTFGFETAVSLAAQVIRSASAEARSVHNGIGLVKLMGRHSGFIAANAALAMRNANLVLIPEIPFEFEGERGLFSYLGRRFERHKPTVIVVAEGAGQHLLERSADRDPSGNIKLGDIGVFLKNAIAERFEGRVNYTLKYIDPSYTIRSAPAGSEDAVFCGYLAQNAAHAGMSGRTCMAVGRSHNRFTHIPLQHLVAGRRTVNPEGAMWISVLHATGQPIFLMDEPPKELAVTSLRAGSEPGRPVGGGGDSKIE